MSVAPALAITRTIKGAATAFTIEDPDAKLLWRGRLPGASTYDSASHTLRTLQAQGAAAIDLLPLALPASWMVNAKATSHAMQRWLSRPAMEAWAAILEGIGFGLAPAEWLALSVAERDAVAGAVAALANGEHSATLAAVSKVLALLRPQIVPLMDDAALWFALELVAEPTTADAPSAPASAFTPMVDWFAQQVIDRDSELIAIAVRHDRAVLDAAQTLDRLVWIESWGYRLRTPAAPDART